MAAEPLRHDHGLTVVDLTIRVERHEGPFARSRGRPPKHAPKPDSTTAFHYRLSVAITDVDPAVIATRLTDSATIILVRTANPSKTDTGMRSQGVSETSAQILELICHQIQFTAALMQMAGE